MAKRAIEEEFDRLYSAYIENPAALPRLKKRVKICKYPDDNTTHQHTSTSTLVPTRHDAISLCVSKNAESDDIMSTGALIDPITVEELETHAASTDHLLPTCSSPAKNEDDNQEASTVVHSSQHCNKPSSDGVISFNDDDSHTMKISQDDNETSDIFMLHKPKMNRGHSQAMQKYLNLDVLWSMHAKRWLHPRFTDESPHAPPVFLKRNLRQGKIFFKQYLKHQEALNNLSKSKHANFKQEPPSTVTCSTYNPSTVDTGSREQVAKKLTSTESNKVQKRKERKPKVHISKKPREPKMETSAPKRSIQKQTSPKSKTLSTKMRPSRKQVLKKDDVVKKASLMTSSKQIWTHEDKGGRQVAVCRPNTKRKMSNQDVGRDTKINQIVDKHPLCQPDAADNPKKRPLADGLTGGVGKSLAVADTEDIGRGITPLFTGESVHCGGIWKTIVDEC